ncbi:MAG: hypothetical protein WD552_01575 [Candidatus Paceibacterota bacterium]
MDAEKLQNQKGGNKELSQIVSRIKERAGAGEVQGSATLAENVSSLSNLSSKERFSINSNGREEQREETSEDNQTSPKEKLPKRPDPVSKSVEESASGEQRPVEKNNEQNEKPGNLSNLVEVGDPVLLVSDSTAGRYTWFIKEVRPDEDGEKIITIQYLADNPDLREERKVRWEDITPRYDSAEMYEKKLQQYEKGLDKAIESKDDFSRYQLGKVLEQINHFAQIYYNNHQK